ncbi:MAG: GNAT family N-acetyltransferase [Clostridia bacterium]|nr:GNAT family N-acetyltransferase [Clostridia bacterium]
MSFEYKTGYDCIDWDSLFALYSETDGVIGLARKGEFDRIKRAFLKSYKVVTAWDGDKIIGVGRMISDGECYAWIHDIAVLPSHRKLGVGKGVMDELIKGNKSLLIGLTSSFEAVDFYKKLGFKKHKTGMAKYPGPSTYLED